ncbi:fimbria/pilus outer membrane usher protein [Paraburkholderia bonniea]|uniref:fimbria/pilus outer membrane usher protein n=1 Tax=Paraburkholderia bonniea TaxID=2152891 RepID=UPI001580E48D|nr:fimbria/pilus outer membrane usher protein [Paraburkholderia bonniea]
MYVAAAAALAQMALSAGATEITPPAAQPALPVSGSRPVFENSMLWGNSASLIGNDQLQLAGGVVSGTYSVDIYLNQIFVSREQVKFEETGATKQVTPCLTAELLTRLGISTGNPAEGASTSQCIDLAHDIPQANVAFDAGELRLDLSVPQASLRRDPQGYVDPSQWDNGVPAAYANYDFNMYRTSGADLPNTSTYLNLNAGANLGAWRFQYLGTGQTNSALHSRSWQTTNAYLQRNFPQMSSQIRVGKVNTTGRYFDSVGIIGASAATDDRMLPDSQRGYAPIIQGIADSNARITVKQNGNIVYETTVAPGPFKLDDLYSTGYSGNLEVLITEADGRTKTMIVPYSYAPNALRAGTTYYSANIGQVNDNGLSSTQRPMLFEATVQHGINNLLTGYTGVAGTEFYLAGLAGLALNTRIGAFSFDVTYAQTKFKYAPSSAGASYRIQYSSFVEPTGTSFSLATYHYSTNGYYNLRDAISAQDLSKGGIFIERQRSQAQATINQDLKTYGQLFTTVAVSNYWNRPGISTQYQVGYSKTFRSASLQLTAARTSTSYGAKDNQISASLTLPLGRQAQAPRLMLSGTNSSSGSSSAMATLNGSFGDDSRLSYGLTTTYSGASPQASSNASLSGNAAYRGSFGEVRASGSKSRGYDQLSANVTGSIIAHSGGVTFGQSFYESAAIIYAPGAAGAKVPYASGVRINDSGYAVLPYLTPYRMNSIELDPKGLDDDVEFKNTRVNIAPTAGAIVKAQFDTLQGRAAMLHVTDEAGKPVPFAAQVLDEKGTQIGVAGQGGNVFVRGIADSGVLTVKWGKAISQACRAQYNLPQVEKKQKGKRRTGYARVEASCSTAGTMAATGTSGTDAAIIRSAAPALEGIPQAKLDARHKNAIQLVDEAGQPMQAAARVFDDQGKQIGITNSDGSVSLQHAASTGVLKIQWGSDKSQSCYAHYQQPHSAQQPGSQIMYAQVTALCSRLGA